MKKLSLNNVILFALIFIFTSGCSPATTPIPPTNTLPVPEQTLTPSSTPKPLPTATSTVTPMPTPKPLLLRGLYVQFERRGWDSEYWSGQIISNYDKYDSVVGHTVSDEVSLQLDEIKKLGVNTIAFELRAADPTTGAFEPPNCNIHPALGLQYPQPTQIEISNLVKFFDLVHSKGMKILLRLVNTHMEEQPPTNNSLWIGTILNSIKDHPALDLVLFEGNTHLVDTDGDGKGDTCGIPAEPPLWLGAKSTSVEYVKWAINYGHSLGLPYRKMSAQAIIGDFFVESNPPAGPAATDNHLWRPIQVLKTIFDDLSIPDDQRTYAVSFYQHRKCLGVEGIPCKDADPNSWAEETLQNVFKVIGRDNGARVIAVEMGLSVPAKEEWNSEQALESLVTLMEKYGVEGGCFWRWVNFSNDEDKNSELASPIKIRGAEFIYNPIAELLQRLYTAP